jgi:hypothetical protein
MLSSSHSICESYSQLVSASLVVIKSRGERPIVRGWCIGYGQAATWTSASPTARRAFLQMVVERVSVKEQSIDVALNRSALRVLLMAAGGLAVPSDAGDSPIYDRPIVLTVQARLMRRGLEMRLVIPSEEPKGPSPRPSQALIKAIVRGAIGTSN